MTSATFVIKAKFKYIRHDFDIDKFSARFTLSHVLFLNQSFDDD